MGEAHYSRQHPHYASIVVGSKVSFLLPFVLMRTGNCFSLPIVLFALLIFSYFSLPLGQSEVLAQEGFTKSDQQASSNGEGPQIASTFETLPLYFIANQGQLDAEQVSYYLVGADKTLYFSADGITFALDGEGKDVASNWTVKLDFVDANPGVKPQGSEPQTAIFSHFRGNPESWNTAIPTFGKIVYTDLWPGIDLVFSGTASTLKYQFIVRSGADPSKIQMAYRGLSELVITQAGELDISTPIASFQDGAPEAWQVVNGKQTAVSMRYALGEKTEPASFPYGFEIGEYNPEEILILDPAILVYCGFLGGKTWENANDVAVDQMGCAYITGRTASNQNSFPVSVGPDLTINGVGDAFVAKVNSQGTGLIYCGYIGGDNSEEGWSIAVDDMGSAYITGVTRSTESTFPVIVGPDLTYNSGSSLFFGDAFVAKVNPQGAYLDYCGYIGGDKTDLGFGITVDSQGHAFVTGGTNSTESTFPLAVGPDLTSNGRNDCFVARVNRLGTGLDYCGYIGGAMGDGGQGVAVDTLGNAYVTGFTKSDQSSFPVKVGPDLTWNLGRDVFVARVNNQGTGLDYCGYIGGVGYDIGMDIAVDKDGSAYVTGNTYSDETSFPVIVGPDLSFNDTNATEDCFVAKVNKTGTGLDFCGYIGGEFDDDGFSLALDHFGNVFVTGRTFSDESSFPVVGGPDLTFNSISTSSGTSPDAFIARVNEMGTTLDYCGYIGGHYGDDGYGIAVDGQGSAYVVGATGSDERSFPVITGPDLFFNGKWQADWDSFIAKIQTTFLDLSVNPDPLIAGQAATFSVTGDAPHTATYLAYSLTGLGSTPVPGLNLTLDLANPILGGGPTNSDAQGRVDWLMFIPLKAKGINIWGQAMQFGVVTTVKLTLIQ
jgi:beta-propeller repeat-containing protein